MGLAGLLAEYGFRVVAGEEGKTHYATYNPTGKAFCGKEVLKVQQITLTVALETPERAVVGAVVK
jgi:hypothetical protein